VAWQRKGQLDRAIADFDAAIRLGPKDVWSYIHRGEAYRAKGQLNRAIADFDAASRLCPGCTAAHVNRNGGHEVKGQIDRAIADRGGEIRLSAGRETGGKARTSKRAGRAARAEAAGPHRS
jgi:tetratricopeptide (TPR) repeat protein